MKVNILGTDYTIKHQTPEENPKMINANGICEFWSKEIIVDTLLPDAESFNNLDAFNQKILRHEIIHAFFGESGLYNYMKDEVLVDWIAMQFDKIAEVFDQLDAEKKRVANTSDPIDSFIHTVGIRNLKKEIIL